MRTRSKLISRCMLAVAYFSLSSTVRPAHARQSPCLSQYQQPPLFRAESSEVDVVVVVRDSNGKPITNLAQEDFEIRDNGKVQNLTHFSSPANPESAQTTANSPSPPAPDTQRRFIALFFDNANTPAEDLVRTQQAARHL